MFYETAQTVGPGWHKSYKPSHYKDMNWSPHNRKFRSPGSSPETYRRVFHNNDDGDSATVTAGDTRGEDFFRSPRRIFKDGWSEISDSRPRLFKRVFRPSSRWETEFGDDEDIPTLRKVERDFDDAARRRRFDDATRRFDDDGRRFDDAKRFSDARSFNEDNRGFSEGRRFDDPNRFNESRKFDSDDKFDDDFNRRFRQRDTSEEDCEDGGRIHHIPIMVERKIDEMRSRFRPTEDNTDDDWVGPEVHRLRRNFEQDPSHRYFTAKPRAFTSPMPDTWDPQSVHTLPTRKSHKASQSFDDCRHPPPSKSVFRSHSETHEDLLRPQQNNPQQHSAAFRSHSDGHCPDKTYVTKVQVQLDPETQQQEATTNDEEKPTASRGSQSLQQIAAVLQNVEDLVPRVEAYNGIGRDKQFRFLDEMLTRCMLRLDDVDTEGREDVRVARKSALRQVQACIDKLEAKAYECEERHQQKKTQIHRSEPQSKEEPVPCDVMCETGEAIPLGDAPMKDAAIPLGIDSAEGGTIPLGNAQITDEPIPLSNTPMRDEPIILSDSAMRNVVIPLGDKPKVENENTNNNTKVSTFASSEDEKTKL